MLPRTCKIKQLLIVTSCVSGVLISGTPTRYLPVKHIPFPLYHQQKTGDYDNKGKAVDFVSIYKIQLNLLHCIISEVTFQ